MLYINGNLAKGSDGNCRITIVLSGIIEEDSPQIPCPDISTMTIVKIYNEINENILIKCLIYFQNPGFTTPSLKSIDH